MFTRANIAGFLQGFFVLLLSEAFGRLIALLFQASGRAIFVCIAASVLVPLAGAIKTRQAALLAGLLAGILVSILVYLGVRPHA